MNNDCQVFTDAASYVGNWISRQPAVKEESLTDWLLFEISQKLPNVHYLAFSRHSEARKTGADWEWWFLYRSGAYRYRIQAKKSNSTGDNYAAIAYTNRYGLQIDKLISDARTVNAIPAYVVFTASQSSKQNKCRTRVRSTGAFSVGAQEAYTQFIAPGKSTVDESRLLAASIPLECFACCPLSSYGCDMEGFISSYFQFEYSALSQVSKDQRPGFHRELPSYAAALLEHRDETPTWIEREFESQLQDFNSLIVYDLRETI